MEREAILQRYRLALALVPDEDVAGDIFMRSRSEEELRRLTQRWHRAQGLVPGERPLPELDEFQQAHALHLYRRGEARRRSLRGLVAALLLLPLAAVGLGWTTLTRAAAVPPALRQMPVRVVLLDDSLRLSIYEARVTPGVVTVWWELSGSEAASQRLLPVLQLPGVEQPVQASETEWFPVRGKRVAARTTYRLHVTTASSIRLRYGGGGPTEWVVECPLIGMAGESEVTVQREAGAGPYTVQIQSVLLSPHHTKVRYRAPVPPAGEPAAPSELQVNSLRLTPVTPPAPVPGSDLMEAVFAEVPNGATRLTLLFDPPRETVGPVVYPLPAPEVVSDVTRLGDRAHVSYRPGRHLRPLISPSSMPYFTDRQGRRLETIEIPPQGWDGIIQYSLVVLDPPPDFEFATLTIPLARRVYPVQPVHLEL